MYNINTEGSTAAGQNVLRGPKLAERNLGGSGGKPTENV